MNLLEDGWIPVRHASGRHRLIAPDELTDSIEADPIVAVDAPRADFNGALVQFLIGLVQTAWVRSRRYWDREALLWTPPSPSALRDLFAPLREAFEFDGAGARFMQDLTLGPADTPMKNSIAALLIEAPGEQSLERNTDHFVKRGVTNAICLECAAAALFTLMTNAPRGGAGHRTSLRGGGPATTLVIYDPDREGDPPRALWRDVACNILDPALFLSTCDRSKTALGHVFPWLGAQQDLQALDVKSEVQPLRVHPAHMFWAMPRRIRLDLDAPASGQCDLCGRVSESLVSRYQTKNYGLNYKGPWRHPLSPYYRSKPTGPSLPVHPRPDGLSYRHWLGWVLGSADGTRQIEPATVVQAFVESGGLPGFRLWAYGYDMDKMKARCWYEATFPLFEFDSGDQDAPATLRGIVDALLLVSVKVAGHLRMAVSDAWFGEVEVRGDLGFIEAGYWSGTEQDFFDCVRRSAALVRKHGRDAVEASASIRKHWIHCLRRSAFALFDAHAARGELEACHPERLAAAYQGLRRQLFGDALMVSLGLKPEGEPIRRQRRAQPT